MRNKLFKFNMFLFLFFIYVNAFALSIDGKISSDWNGGYCYKMNLENTQQETIKDWKISLNIGKSEVINKWNGTFDCKNGFCNIKSLYWNKRINKGEKIEVGFCVNGTDKPLNLKVSFDNINNNIKYFPIKLPGNIVSKYNGYGWPIYETYKNILSINPWNIKTSTGTSFIYYDKNSNIITYIQDFKKVESKGGTILGYPEVFIGNKPWGGSYKKGANLPIKTKKIDSINIESSWYLKYKGDLPINFASEGWFTKKEFEKAKVGKGEVEMMIMWYKNNLWGAGSLKGEFTTKINVNGKYKDIIFDVYVRNGDWDFITFIPKNTEIFKKVDIKYDLKSFIDETKIYLPEIENLYLEDWEIGSEYGALNDKTSTFSFQINKFNVLAKEVNNSVQQVNNLEYILKNISNKNIENINNWKNKIEKLYLTFPSNYKNIKYKNIFIKYFNLQKNKVLNNNNNLNEKYYNILKEFINYSNLIFVDISNKNFKNIKKYISDFRKIIEKMKQIN